MKKFKQPIFLALAAMLFACGGNGQQTKTSNAMTISQTETTSPRANDLITSPLRNRIKLELHAPLKDVWNLVGNPGRMPEYSAGLESVETKSDGKGNCTEYTCHFKPFSPGEKGADHRAIMKWYQPLKGWASIDEEPNPFGLRESLSLLTFAETDGKTILQWDIHFNADDLEWNKKGFEQALDDIDSSVWRSGRGEICRKINVCRI
jgi:hypothetical protein